MSNETQLTDARGNRPSASRMTRIFNCPASFQLNAMEISETSAAAEEGRMLHRVMELAVKLGNESEKPEFDALFAALTDEQRQAYLTAVKLVNDNVLCDFRAYNGDRMEVFEKRLWAASGLFSGQGDAVFIKDDGEATIVDYKFGRGEVEPAERNYQLAAMAVLVADNYGVEQIEKVRALIIQPRALDKNKRITECVYTKADVDAAREAINAACKEAIEYAQPRQKCGYWCNYCKSAYRCKTAQLEIAKQYAIATSTPTLAIGAHNVVEMFTKATVVKKLCDEILAAVKNFIVKNPDHGTALELAAGAKRSKLGDAGKIYDAVCSIGITPEEFVEVCDVGLTKLQSLYFSKRKIVNEKQTKKASDFEVKDLLESKGLLTYTQVAPSLRLKEEK